MPGIGRLTSPYAPNQQLIINLKQSSIMSHFIGLVFLDGNYDSYDDILAPYDEQTTDEDYIEFQDCTDEVTEKFNNLPEVDEDTEHRYPLDRAHYPTIESLANDYYDYRTEIDEQGNKRYGYRCNPNAKWDWYSEGGRWRGFIKGTDGRNCDSAPFAEIDWDAMLTDEHAPFCFVSADGVWHEKGEMGWWAMVANEKEPKDWLTELKDYVQSIKKEENEGDDIYVYAIDFHI